MFTFISVIFWIISSLENDLPLMTLLFRQTCSSIERYPALVWAYAKQQWACNLSSQMCQGEGFTNTRCSGQLRSNNMPTFRTFQQCLKNPYMQQKKYSWDPFNFRHMTHFLLIQIAQIYSRIGDSSKDKVDKLLNSNKVCVRLTLMLAK